MENKKEIIFVASGNIEIPPKGYGAVEDIIWNYKENLEKKGYTIKIINTKNIFKLIKETVFVNNKIIHFHYEPSLIISYILNKVFFRKNRLLFTCHNGYLVNNQETKNFKIIARIISCFHNVEMISISKPMEDYFIKKGFRGKKYIIQNGIDTKRFIKTQKPKKDIIYLGNINKNKGQERLLNNYSLKNKIDFVGPYLDKSMKLYQHNYIGIWTKKEVFEKLGDYKVLVLLTKSEAGTPLVVKEALSAGCSVLVSKIAGINLTKNEFIRIMDIENKEELEKIDEYIKDLLKNNEKNREKIWEYSKRFDWENIMEEYEKII